MPEVTTSDCSFNLLEQTDICETYTISIDEEFTSTSSGPKLGHGPEATATTLVDGEGDTEKVPQTSVPTPSLGGPSSVLATVTGQTNAADGPVETASPLAAPTSSGGSKGISKGAVAGIAIATAIIGAAIAFFAAFILFKRRKRPTGHHSPYGSTPDLVAYSKVPKGHTPYVSVSQSAAPPPPIAAAAVPPPRRDLDLATLANSSDFLAGVLPPAADESTVKNRVAALFNQVQQHVDNFYRDVHASITPTMEKDLARFGNEGASIAEMLQNSSMPTAVIKHTLAGYILNIVSAEGEDQSTLFPAELTGIRENEQFDTPDRLAAYVLYRRLAVHLHAPTPSTLQTRQSDIREAAEHFALTFFPWASPTFNEQDKDEELVQIISSALDLSIWLYGEPFLYEFVWEGVGRRGTVVAPGLVRATDERGRICERPQVLLEPVVVAD